MLSGRGISLAAGEQRARGAQTNRAIVMLMRTFQNADTNVSRLPRHIVHLRVHIVGGFDDFGVALVSALREHHLDKLADHIDI